MVTRKEVAARAGVSTSTVSRVVNGDKHVSEEARKRVLASIEELRYIPNRAARGLRTKTYKQISCITPSITNSFFSEILSGVEERTAERGYSLSLHIITKENLDSLSVFNEGLYDGLIVLAPFEMRKIIHLEDLTKKFPLSLYWDKKEQTNIPHVFIDLEKAMSKSVQNLIDNGHENIIFLGPNIEDQYENPRLLGYKETMIKNGLDIQDYYLNFIEQYEDSMTNGYLQVKKLINKNKSFTAIAASNDLLAAGAIRAIVESSKKIPEDISVMGMDNIELSSIVTPTLSTMDIPKKEIGRKLADQLITQINGEKPVDQVVEFDVQLINRESVKNRLTM
nr:LacI family DNA-binding transcriptional regulator [Lederbergia citrea]